MLTEKWGRHVGSGLTFRDERKDKVKRKKDTQSDMEQNTVKGKSVLGTTLSSEII